MLGVLPRGLAIVAPFPSLYPNGFGKMPYAKFNPLGFGFGEKGLCLSRLVRGFAIVAPFPHSVPATFWQTPNSKSWEELSGLLTPKNALFYR